MDKDVVCIYIYIHIYIMEYYSALIKKEILPFATIGINLVSLRLSEISHTEKDILPGITYR